MPHFPSRKQMNITAMLFAMLAALLLAACGPGQPLQFLAPSLPSCAGVTLSPAEGGSNDCLALEVSGVGTKLVLRVTTGSSGEFLFGLHAIDPEGNYVSTLNTKPAPLAGRSVGITIYNAANWLGLDIENKAGQYVIAQTQSVQNFIPLVPDNSCLGDKPIMYEDERLRRVWSNEEAGAGLFVELSADRSMFQLQKRKLGEERELIEQYDSKPVPEVGQSVTLVAMRDGFLLKPAVDVRNCGGIFTLTGLEDTPEGKVDDFMKP